MSLSSCPKCWNDLCTCGYAYVHLPKEELEKIRAVIGLVLDETYVENVVETPPPAFSIEGQPFPQALPADPEQLATAAGAVAALMRQRESTAERLDRRLPFIVAEISHAWTDGMAEGGIAAKFEDVIEVNRLRGYALCQFGLSRVRTQDESLIETIVAVFERKDDE